MNEFPPVALVLPLIVESELTGFRVADRFEAKPKLQPAVAVENIVRVASIEDMDVLR